MNFPTKLDKLNQLGIIAPRILKKINHIRNLLEHQYKIPKKEEVEDAIDVAMLFIEYTNKFIYRFVNSIDVECNGIDFNIRISNDGISIYIRSPTKTDDEEFFITYNDKGFYEWTKFVIENEY